MHRYSKLLLTLPFILFLSCEEKEDGPSIDRVVGGNVTATALSVDISGTFNEFTQKDMMYGTTGVLYCEQSEDSQSLFEAWKNGGKADCSVAKGGDLDQTGGFSITVRNLCPSTRYDCCLFFEKEDGERFIGQTMSFTTSAFNPEIQPISFSSVRYYDATGTGTVNGNGTDLKQCRIGVILSYDSSVSVEEDIIMDATLGDDGTFPMKLKQLESNSAYYVATFIYVKPTDSYIIGTVQEIRTKSIDEMAVDLGLSVKWANCELGAQSYDEDGECYAWGMLKPNHQGTLEYYEHYHDGAFADIGPVISGNEKYDVVKATLKGKWRMPTADEVNELIAECERTLSKDGLFVVYTAKNGNVLYFNYDMPSYGKYSAQMYKIDCLWTGTAAEDDPSKAYMFCAGSKILSTHYDRFEEYCIRPVMDY